MVAPTEHSIERERFGATNPCMQLHAEAIHGPPPASIFHHYSNTAEIATYITRGELMGAPVLCATKLSGLNAQAIDDFAPLFPNCSTGDGQAITYTPLFTYMGFRYVQLTVCSTHLPPRLTLPGAQRTYSC